MAAEDAIRLHSAGASQRTGRNLLRQAQPTRAQAIGQPREVLSLDVDLLQEKVEKAMKAAEQDVVENEPVKLVAVNRQVAMAAEFPRVLLVDLDSDQVGHDVGQPLIMVAFHPHDFDSALRVG